MTTDKRIGKKVAPFVLKDNTEAPGIHYDSGPYIGKIKNNFDPTASGALQVWIPDLTGGDENDAKYWRTVNYASPFFGASSQEVEVKKNTYTKVRHTYGMWFTPPDIDNFVICTFIAGDPLRGFWFACVPAQLGHHMVPAIGASKNYSEDGVQDSTVSGADKGDLVPTVEFNENDKEDWSNFSEFKKPIHEDHYKSIVKQGLQKDIKRGIISSTSQRESPSSVFGISTPGYPITQDDKMNVFGRKGGHTFVMDDGDYEEKNKLMRFRSSGGHQIMMNDTDEVFHIINSRGTVWIELEKNGNLNIFCEKDLNIRAKGNFNLHSDSDMTFNAEGEFKVKAKKDIKIETDTDLTLLSKQKTTVYASDINAGADGQINLNPKGEGSWTCDGELTLKASKIKLNSGSGPTVDKPDPITENDHADTEESGVNWQSQDGKKKSILPEKSLITHEPFKRESDDEANPNAASASSAGGAGGATSSGTTSGGKKGFGKTPGAVNNGIGGPGVNADGTPNFGGPAASQDAGPLGATGKGIQRAVDPSYMNRSDNPSPTKDVGNLSSEQVKALKTQIAWSESGYNYGSENQFNYLGKYQMGSAALTDQGYIKPDAYAKYGQAAVNYPSSWTGKDGVNSKESFLSNGSVQERTMDNLLQRNYNTMARTGGIRADDDPSTVGGMLSTAHLLGPGGATNWRQTGVGQDANRTTGGTYFNQGRYAMNVLATGGRG